jgi:hypothetical protein
MDFCPTYYPAFTLEVVRCQLILVRLRQRLRQVRGR